MEKLVKDIYDVLCKEYYLQCELLGLSKKKTDLIVNNKIKELESLLSLEEGIVVKLGELENERGKLTEQYFQGVGKEPQPNSLTSIIQDLNHEDGQLFRDLKKQFGEIIDQQREINKTNMRLIKENLDYIDFTINLLTQKDQPTYGSKKKDSISLFDEQI